MAHRLGGLARALRGVGASRADRRPIVIADAQDDFRDALVESLARMGLRAIGASSARSAIAIARTRDVAAVYAEHTLAPGGGLALLEAVRRVSRSQPVGVLAAPHADVATLAPLVHRMGAVLLPRPFAHEQLFAAIRASGPMRAR